jgi:hypothetical protein
MKIKRPRYKWQPLRQSATNSPFHDAVIEETVRVYNVTREEAVAKLEAYEAQCTYWINDLYQVQRRECGGSMVHLNIRRRDGGPIMRDWRHFQQIKNELVGEECEAIELYPAESRKVDTTNKYHLYAVTDPTFRFPVGFDERDVEYEQLSDKPGLRQRPL